MRSTLDNCRPDKAFRRLRGIILLAFGIGVLSYSIALPLENTPADDTGTLLTVTEDTIAHVPGQLVIRFNGHAEETGDFARMLDTAGIDRMRTLPVYLLQFDTSVNINELARMLQSREGISYTQPNYILDSLDPLQGSRPIGDDIGGNTYRQYAVDMLELTSAHTVATGIGVKVGIVDCGVDTEHPAFSNKFHQGWDFVDNDDIPFDEPGGEISGHGTFVAGIVHLVAPDAELIPYRVMNANGAGHGFAVAKAIEQAVLDSCKVVNLSLQIAGRHHAVADAIALAESQRVIVVAAAGNYGHGAPGMYPATDPYVIGVAAVDSEMVIPDFSSYGSYADYCAPGVDVYSAYQDDRYAWWSGTSFSAPFMAGQLALLGQVFLGYSKWEIEYALSDASTVIELPFVLANYWRVGELNDGPCCSVTALAHATIGWLQHNVPPDTIPFAVIVPEEYYCRTGPECTNFRRRRQIWTFSTNYPAPLTARLLPGGDGYVALEEGSKTGMTCGLPIYFSTLDTVPLEPGVYVDTIEIIVEGVDEPLYTTVYLDATEPCCPIEDSARIISLNGTHFTINQGTGNIATDTALFYLESTNEPAHYVMWHSPISRSTHDIFIDAMFEATAFTPDTCGVLINGSGLAQGIYYDTFYVRVDGVANNRIWVPLTLEIIPTQQSVEPGEYSFELPSMNFRLDRDSDVHLSVYDVAGREVKRLMDTRLAAGDHEMIWYGTDREGVPVPAGVYVFRLRVAGEIEAEELILLE